MGENESLTKWQGRLEQVIPWTTWNDPALLSHLLYHVNPRIMMAMTNQKRLPVSVEDFWDTAYDINGGLSYGK